MRMTDQLTTLLNKCHALIECGFVTISQCASDIHETPQRVSEWITQRAHKPSGKVALKLHDWAAQKTSQISMVEHRDKQAAYRSSYKTISARFPGNGKEN